MNKAIDRWTGREVDRLSDLLPKANGGHCDHCGHYTIDRCPMCGAPQCCPRCCLEATSAHHGPEVG